MKTVSIRFPTDIRFGAGMIRQLPEFLKSKKMTKPLIVTDKGLAGLPVFKRVLSILAEQNMSNEVYSDASGNPVESHVTLGVQAYRKGSCDSLVVMGGGCALDVGKAISLMIHHPGSLFDYEDDMVGARPVDQKLPPLIAIPTTAGTGSEVGGSSVISREDTHAKVIVWSGRLIPDLVVADPELTVDLPPAVTASTGIDALTHNIEAFLAKNYHPVCDGIALEGIRLVFNSLENAVKEPGNIDARADMLMASMMGAVAFQKGLGVTHSCAHSLSTCFDMHHGLANALTLVAAMKFNQKAVPERFIRMGRIIGLDGDDAGDKFIDAIERLLKTLGLPEGLGACGVQISDALLDTAFKDSCHANNPVPCSRNDIESIYQNSM